MAGQQRDMEIKPIIFRSDESLFAEGARLPVDDFLSVAENMQIDIREVLEVDAQVVAAEIAVGLQ